MKKTLTLTAIIASALTLTACGDATTQVQANDPVNSITIAGSTTVAPLAQALADAFLQANTGYSIEVQSMGTGAGMTAAIEGIADIGLASRELNADERAQLDHYTVAIDGIAVIVNQANSVSDLSFDDIQAIFLGDITNWSQVGGENQDIIVVSREAGSGARGSFESLADVADSVAYTLVGTGSNGVLTSVEANPWAIGYVTYGLVAGRNVNPVAVDGVPFSGAAASSGEYPFAIGFHMAFSNAGINSQTQTFLNWVMSDAGQAVVTAQEYVAVR